MVDGTSRAAWRKASKSSSLATCARRGSGIFSVDDVARRGPARPEHPAQDPEGPPTIARYGRCPVGEVARCGSPAGRHRVGRARSSSVAARSRGGPGTAAAVMRGTRYRRACVSGPACRLAGRRRAHLGTSGGRGLLAASVLTERGDRGARGDGQRAGGGASA